MFCVFLHRNDIEFIYLVLDWDVIHVLAYSSSIGCGRSYGIDNHSDSALSQAVNSPLRSIPQAFLIHASASSPRYLTMSRVWPCLTHAASSFNQPMIIP